jgi:transcriptional regulator with XRE-family HTH domain
MTKGEKVRLLRENKELTREALAREIGYSPQMIYKIESGEKEPSTKFLNSITKYFNVSLSFFIDEIFDDIFKDIQSKDLEYIILNKPSLEYKGKILSPDERQLFIEIINSALNIIDKFKFITKQS